jgi:hypothetical protein
VSDIIPVLTENAAAIESAEPVEVNVRVSAKKLSYRDFKRLLRVQDGGLPMTEAMEILEKCVINLDELMALPAVDVIPAIVQTVNAAVGAQMSPKV